MHVGACVWGKDLACKQKIVINGHLNWKYNLVEEIQYTYMGLLDSVDNLYVVFCTTSLFGVSSRAYHSNTATRY